VALQLKRKGLTRVRPLHGGLRLWMDHAFPVIDMKQSLAGRLP